MFSLYAPSSCNLRRPNEKKLIDIIEFQCNKLQPAEIYGNLARNFEINGMSSTKSFSFYHVFFHSAKCNFLQNIIVLDPLLTICGHIQ